MKLGVGRGAHSVGRGQVDRPSDQATGRRATLLRRPGGGLAPAAITAAGYRRQRSGRRASGPSCLLRRSRAGGRAPARRSTPGRSPAPARRRRQSSGRQRATRECWLLPSRVEINVHTTQRGRQAAWQCGSLVARGLGPARKWWRTGISTTARPHCSTAVRQHGSAAARPPGRAAARPHGRATARQHGSTAAGPRSRTAAPERDSTGSPAARPPSRAAVRPHGRAAARQPGGPWAWAGPAVVEVVARQW
jgi:hypothetical protein